MVQMTTAISHINSGGSLAEWQSGICRDISVVNISNNDGREFLANLYRRKFSSAEIMRLDVPAVYQTRSPSGIKKDNVRDIQLVYLDSGEVGYRQYGQEFFVRPRDCFIIDHGNPYELFTDGRSQSFSVRIPRPYFVRYFGPDEIVTNRIDGDSCWGSVLSAYLRAMYLSFENMHAMSPSLLVEQALRFVELTMERDLSRATTHQRALVRRIRSIIHDMYHHEDLSPTMVAGMAGVSRGYMHRLLSQVGTTFCKELDTIRIDRATALLEARDHQHLTIVEIGHRCGLPNAPHFTRKFRSLKGMSPSQYRQFNLVACH